LDNIYVTTNQTNNMSRIIENNVAEIIVIALAITIFALQM